MGPVPNKGQNVIAAITVPTILALREMLSLGLQSAWNSKLSVYVLKAGPEIMLKLKSSTFAETLTNRDSKKAPNAKNGQTSYIEILDNTQMSQIVEIVGLFLFGVWIFNWFDLMIDAVWH